MQFGKSPLFRDAVAVSKPLVFFLCLLPLAHLGWDVVHNTLGTDPVAQLEHRTGDWSLRLLLATLAITPLRKISGWNKATRYRRMLGLFAFFYISVHLGIYLVIDLGGFWSQLLGEIVKRPYITVGFGAWVLLIPLALTSTKAMMRRLGRRWQPLHRLVYPAAFLGVVHFMWLVKADKREPSIYLAIFLVLMLWRLPQLAALPKMLRRAERPGPQQSRAGLSNDG
ncbi:MAG TPA: protein-methionine-sulfoxide reductase heme-binding subunit MsrQ [Rudaea sp.]|nr:protein-methionine-sulfoxide reductase heme-binding subunit MsrQ [Rudaea sp.]